MPAHGTPIDPEVLLANTSWVRALARSLLADGHRADDVVQSTLAAAVERPPRDDVPLRPWLARVARNFALQTLRSEKRRARHEASARVPSGESAGPDESAARVDTALAVVAAVRALDPIYRDVVVLRFFDGLESAQAAARLGVPVETARTRLKRALALLRERLDKEYGGDGRAWALALVPVAALPRGATVAMTAEAAATAAAGGAIVAASTKAVVAAAVLGALIGSGLTAGVMTIDETGEPSSGVRDSASAARDVSSPRHSKGDAAAAADDAAAARPSQRAARPGESAPRDPAIAAWIETVAVDLPPPGTGRITGHVKTKDGAPVAGVVVRATRPRTNQVWTPGAPPAEPPVEDMLRDAVIHAKWRSATTRETVTDATGTFTLSAVTDGAHWLRAYADGWAIGAAQESSSSDVRPGGSVEFVARAFVSVPLVVRLPDGSAPTDKVTVRWTPTGARGGGGNSTWSLANAVFQVEPGAWTFTAEIGNELKSEDVAVSVVHGTPAEPITLQLAPRNVVTGRIVLDPADAGWASVQVSARRRDTGAAAGERAYARPPDWTYRLEDLEPGEYELKASLDERAPRASTVVRVTGGRVVQDIAIPRLTAAEALTVRVVGPDGSPLPVDDLTFRMLERSATGSSSGGVRWAQQPDGSYRIALGATSHPNEAMQSFVEVTSKRCGKKEVEFERGKTESVEVRFGDAAVFRPTIAAADGSPFASASPLGNRVRVTLAATDASEFQAIGSRSRDVLPVAPGSYVALVWIADANDIGRIVARIPVELRAGVNPVTIRVPELHTLKVRLPGAAGGTKVYLSGAQRPQRDADLQIVLLSADGTATFEDVPAGLHIVAFTPQGTPPSEWSEMLVRVPAAETTFATTTIGGFLVRVDDAAGMLAASGFRSGDVIVSVDGMLIDTFQRIDAAIYRARERPEIPVVVQRGTERVTLTIDPAKYWARGPRGGWWEPVLR